MTSLIQPRGLLDGSRFQPLIEVVWEGAGGAERATLDGRTLEPPPSVGDRLPRLAGVLRWVDDDGPHRVELSWDPDVRPKRVVGAMLAKCVERLRHPDSPDLPAPFNYGSPAEVAPEPAELKQFERYRIELGRVCDRPAVELLPEEMWLPVHKVRRLARSAVAALARSPRALAPPSGPLERLGLRSPMPLRVLAELRDESLDRYGNHVVADLVRRLTQAIGLWILDLEDLRSTIGEALADAKLLRYLGQGSRNEELGRLFSVLKGGAEEFHQSLQELLERGGTARASLGSSRASNLLANLEPRRVSPPLKATNLFTHHPSYAPLGDCWQAIGGRTDPIPFDPVADDPDLAYRDFSLLVLARGLDELGFKATSPIPFAARGANAPVLFENSAKEGSCRSVEVAPEGLLDFRVTFQFKDADAEAGPIQFKRGKTVRGQARGKRSTDSWVMRPRFLRLGEGVPPSSFPTDAAAGEARPLWLIADVDRTGIDAESAEGALQPFPANGEGLRLVVGPLHLASADRVKAWLLGRTLGRDLRRGVSRDACPVCKSPGTGPAHDRECPRCKAAWGWESCGSCKAKIPKLVPQRPNRAKLAEVAQQLDTPWAQGRVLEIAFGAWRVGRMAIGTTSGSFSWTCASCEQRKGKTSK